VHAGKGEGRREVLRVLVAGGWGKEG